MRCYKIFTVIALLCLAFTLCLSLSFAAGSSSSSSYSPPDGTRWLLNPTFYLDIGFAKSPAYFIMIVGFIISSALSVLNSIVFLNGILKILSSNALLCQFLAERLNIVPQTKSSTNGSINISQALTDSGKKI